MDNNQLILVQIAELKDIMMSNQHMFNNDINEIKNDILCIKNNLKKINDKLIIINEQNNKMDKHVDFINNVYEQVESPLNYICNKVNLLLYKSPPNNDNLLTIT